MSISFQSLLTYPNSFSQAIKHHKKLELIIDQGSIYCFSLCHAETKDDMVSEISLHGDKVWEMGGTIVSADCCLVIKLYLVL